MTALLDFSAPPFSSLGAAERQAIRQAIDVARYEPGEHLKEAGAEWTGLHLVLRGRVEARSGESSSTEG